MTRCLCAFGLASGVILFFLGLTGSEEPGETCVSESCHVPIYNDGTSNPFLHTPFVDKQCDSCHLKQTTTTAFSERRGKSVTQPVILSQPDFQEEHTVLIKGLIPKAVYDISVTLQDTSGTPVTQEFRGIIPANIQDVRPNDGKAPRITEVKMGPVRKGVFLETTIAWKTNEPPTSQVEYGLSDRYGRQTSESSALVEKHVKTIHELESGQNYHFRVISRDIFGNEAVSGDFQFSTTDVSPSQSSIAESDDDGNKNTLTVHRAEIFLLDADLGVHIGMSKPARITIELLKVHDTAPEQMVAEFEAAVVKDIQNPEVCPNSDRLREGKDLMIDACYQCHPPEELGVSHPVGIEPSEKTTIPDDLPTLKGGVMTCITCHFPHSGERQYFARKDIDKDICLSCHEGY